MFPITQQFSSTAKAQLEAQFQIFQSLANSALAGTEQIIALQLSTGKAALENSAATARQLIASHDAREIISLGVSQTQPGIEQALAYGRQLFGIASGTQAALLAAAKAAPSAAADAVSDAPAPTWAAAPAEQAEQVQAAAPAVFETPAVTLTSVPTPVARDSATQDSAAQESATHDNATPVVVVAAPSGPTEHDSVEPAQPIGLAHVTPATAPTLVAEAVATLIDNPAPIQVSAAPIAAPGPELTPGLKPAGEAPVLRSSGPSLKPNVAGNASKQSRGLKK